MGILSLTEITKIYSKGVNQVKALNGVAIEIEQGEFLAIVGPSGSGKTTLLNIIGCLDTPTKGSVHYEGKALHSMSENDLALYRRDKISFIFQSYNLIPVLTVRENIALPLVISATCKKSEIKTRVDAVIESVSLSDKADKYPRELSGGQEQRVAIARALVKNPLVVLADEPTANLDSVTAQEIISLMQKINTEKNVTFIFSTHDQMVQTHAKRIITIRDGMVFKDERKQ